MSDWRPTRICGCGECRFWPTWRTCPNPDARGAVKLWAHSDAGMEPSPATAMKSRYADWQAALERHYQRREAA